MRVFVPDSACNGEDFGDQEVARAPRLGWLFSSATALTCLLCDRSYRAINKESDDGARQFAGPTICVHLNLRRLAGVPSRC